ncbi:MAG: cyanophycinase, partial [Bacteroidota bacterium]
MRALAGVSVLFWLVPAVLAQGPVLVHGGGGDVREAYDWFVAQVPSKQVIVLDYTGDPGIPTVRRLEASGAQVRYLPVASRTAAQDSSIVQAVRAADALFFPGGNQYRYVQRWADTPLQRAIQAAHRRGAAIGGTSAGAMILGEVVFDARDGTVTTPDALDDPMGIPLLDGFLNILPGFIVDTHFAERGRIGRLAAWLAQRTVRHPTRFLEGLGVDTDTAVAIEPDGTMTVFGDGTLTLLGQPLSGIDVEDGLDA